mmetsp:Transcript_36357/g.77537  ORF Transcript_36357/g.77537 Transcript_36357/m.77537 type:complete len:121 (+) Transcript_36357:114-476(+)
MAAGDSFILSLALHLHGGGGGRATLRARLLVLSFYLFFLILDGWMAGSENGRLYWRVEVPASFFYYSYMLGRMTSQNKSYYSLLREPSAAYRVKKAKNTSKKDKRARKTLAFFLCLLAAA